MTRNLPDLSPNCMVQTELAYLPLVVRNEYWSKGLSKIKHVRFALADPNDWALFEHLQLLSNHTTHEPITKRLQKSKSKCLFEKSSHKSSWSLQIGKRDLAHRSPWFRKSNYERKDDDKVFRAHWLPLCLKRWGMAILPTGGGRLPPSLLSGG